MPYADDAAIISRSPDGLVGVMTVVVDTFEGSGLKLSQKKAGTPLVRVPENPPKEGVVANTTSPTISH